MEVCAKYFLIQPLLSFLGPFYILRPPIKAIKPLKGKTCILKQFLYNKSGRTILTKGGVVYFIHFVRSASPSPSRAL